MRNLRLTRQVCSRYIADMEYKDIPDGIESFVLLGTLLGLDVLDVYTDKDERLKALKDMLEYQLSIWSNSIGESVSVLISLSDGRVL